MSDDRVRTGRDVALVIVAGAIALRWPTAALIALFAAGSVVRWVDGRSWTSTRPVEPWQLAAGAAIGAA
ncbi:MAG: hypothetical protein KC464_30200, partial [Myxococcales bacterium]|nr:hypothetical protein [Myxococcales bacterium]